MTLEPIEVLICLAKDFSFLVVQTSNFIGVISINRVDNYFDKKKISLNVWKLIQKIPKINKNK